MQIIFPNGNTSQFLPVSITQSPHELVSLMKHAEHPYIQCIQLEVKVDWMESMSGLESNLVGFQAFLAGFPVDVQDDREIGDKIVG